MEHGGVFSLAAPRFGEAFYPKFFVERDLRPGEKAGEGKSFLNFQLACW
ncbi:MAG: hypothetical protein ACKVUS_05035 [Saprospiraceae bacterium]